MSINPTPRSTFVTRLATIFIVLSFYFMANYSAMIYFPFWRLSLRETWLIFIVFIIMTILSLISAIALLKRKNWGRRLFIIMRSVNILILSMVILLRGIDILREEFWAGNIIISVIAAVIIILFGWIIKRLVSPAIVNEFTRST